MDDDDREFEHSSLSGAFARDGETVEVEIYRFEGETGRWRMEVVHLSGCVRWRPRLRPKQKHMPLSSR